VTKWKLFEFKEKNNFDVANPRNQSNNEQSVNYKMLILTKSLQLSHS
jgi:hypothetical protein